MTKPRRFNFERVADLAAQMRDMAPDLPDDTIMVTVSEGFKRRQLSEGGTMSDTIPSASVVIMPPDENFDEVTFMTTFNIDKNSTMRGRITEDTAKRLHRELGLALEEHRQSKVDGLVPPVITSYLRDEKKD